MESEIVSQILWRLVIVLAVSCLLFTATFLGSFSVYNFTKGKIYQQLKKQSNHFFLRSFFISLLIAVALTAFDLPNVLFALITDTPINKPMLLILIMIQTFLIVVIGSPVVWLSFKLAIPLAHRLFQHRFNN